MPNSKAVGASCGGLHSPDSDFLSSPLQSSGVCCLSESSPIIILAFVSASAAAMLYLIRAYPSTLGYFISVVMGLGTFMSLGSLSRRYSLALGAATTVFLAVSNMSLTPWSVVLRGIATFISALSIGVYFSRLIAFRRLVMVSSLLAVYDFVAVFITRHMVQLNEAGRNIMPLIAVPYLSDGALMLPGTGVGSGDLVILAALIAGTQAAAGTKAAKLAAAGALIGFASTYLIMAALGVWLAPGLPGIVFGALIGVFLSQRLGRH